MDVTVPFMGWKKEVAWYFNMDTVQEYGNEREVSDVGFDFVQAVMVCNTAKSVGKRKKHFSQRVALWG